MSPIDSISRLLAKFPGDRRSAWLALAFHRAGLTDLLSNCTPHADPLELIDSRHRQITLDQLVRLEQELRKIHEAARQTRWIRYLLSRPNFATQWLEAWHEAITQPTVVEHLSSTPQLAQWITDSLASSSPPQTLDLVTWLDHDMLRTIRRSIDRDFKRFARSAPCRKLVEDEPLAAISQSPIDLDPLHQALDTLDLKSQTAIYLRFFEGLTLQQIAAEMNMASPTKVHRLLRDALAQLHKLLS